MKNYLFSHTNFKLIFIIYVFINTLAIGYFGINIDILSISIIIWGSIIIINDFYNKQIDYHDCNFICLILYAIILILATCLNPYSTLKSYLMAFMQLIIFVLIYGNKKGFTNNTMKNELTKVIPLVNILTGIAGSISILMYFFNFTSINNGWPIGMVGDRLFGVYFNCNPASFLSAIIILLALLALKYRYKYRNGYIFNIIIQLLYLVLTKCRTSLIILAIIISALIYLHFFKAKRYSKIKKYFYSLSLCIFIFICCIFVNNGLSFLSGNIEKTNSRFQIENIIKSINYLFEGDIQPSLHLLNQISSGRLELLNTSIEIWQTSPIIGIGAGNFQTIGINRTTGSVVKQIQVVHSHNIFVETLVTTGIIGAALFLYFFCQIIKHLFKLLKKNQNTSLYSTVLIFILIVCSEFIGGMFDYGLFYTYSLSATLCWLCLGYLTCLSKDS